MKIKTVVVVWLLFIACVLGQNAGPSLVPQSGNTDAATLQPMALTKLAAPHYQASRGRFFILLGNDGDSLVYATGRSSATVYWSHTNQAEGTK